MKQTNFCGRDVNYNKNGNDEHDADDEISYKHGRPISTFQNMRR